MGRIVAPSVMKLEAAGHGPGVIETGIENPVHHPAGFIGSNVVGALGPGSAARLDHHARAQRQQVLELRHSRARSLMSALLRAAAQGGVVVSTSGIDSVMVIVWT